MENPATVAKFTARENAVAYNRNKFNRLDAAGQAAYRKRVNRERITYNIQFADGTFISVLRKRFNECPAPQTPHRDYYTAI